MRVAVVGAGSWGMALAHALTSAGCETSLWARDPEVATVLTETRRHPWALPGVELRSDTMVTSLLPAALAAAGVVILTVPSHGLRDTAAGCVPHAGGAILVSAAKGFEMETGLTMTGVLAEVVSGRRVAGIAALSGPNIAIEVGRGLPAATVVAARDPATAAAVRDACNGGSLRFYSTDDTIGVEYGGALKNVVAIAAGICDGIGVGDNGKAALITRGIAEIARLAVRAGGNPMTIAGLAGLGDCVVTCMSPHSRNRSLGEAIGRGVPPAEAIAATQMVLEGVNATRAARSVAARLGVDMPIAQEIHAVLFEGKSVAQASTDLMTRASVDELRGLELDMRPA